MLFMSISCARLADLPTELDSSFIGFAAGVAYEGAARCVHAA